MSVNFGSVHEQSTPGIEDLFFGTLEKFIFSVKRRSVKLPELLMSVFHNLVIYQKSRTV